MKEELEELRRLLAISDSEPNTMIERCRRIVALWRDLNLNQDDEDFLTILSIDSQTDHLPQGEPRLAWNSDALVSLDSEIADFDEAFKHDFERACWGLTKLLRSRSAF